MNLYVQHFECDAAEKANMKAEVGNFDRKRRSTYADSSNHSYSDLLTNIQLPRVFLEDCEEKR
jgi:hypothetical protein